MRKSPCTSVRRVAAAGPIRARGRRARTPGAARRGDRATRAGPRADPRSPARAVASAGMRWIAASAPARSSISRSRVGHPVSGEDRTGIGRAGQRLEHRPARPEHLVMVAMDRPRPGPAPPPRRPPASSAACGADSTSFPPSRAICTTSAPREGVRNANVSRDAPLLSRRSSPASGSPSTSPRRSAIARVRACASAPPLSTNRTLPCAMALCRVAIPTVRHGSDSPAISVVGPAS